MINQSVTNTSGIHNRERIAFSINDIGKTEYSHTKE
jgi:hypothetical protein